VELLVGRCFEHRYRPHFHDEFVVAAFTAGAQQHSVGRHQGVAIPGSVLIIPAGEAHTGHAARDADGWCYRAFYPDAGTLSALASELFAGQGGLDLNVRAAPLYQDPDLAGQLAALHRVIDHDPAPLARQQAFAAAMAAVLLRYVKAGRQPRPVRPERRAVRLAIEYARARFADAALGAADFASVAGLSPYHFMRCFRAATGVTLHGFVVQLRIQEARRMLARGVPAADVAQAVGFADQSHLIRHFRAALGVTPGQYAKETQKRAGAAG